MENREAEEDEEEEEEAPYYLTAANVDGMEREGRKQATGSKNAQRKRSPLNSNEKEEEEDEEEERIRRRRRRFCCCHRLRIPGLFSLNIYPNFALSPNGHESPKLMSNVHLQMGGKKICRSRS
jgi:hypothetical protein